MKTNLIEFFPNSSVWKKCQKIKKKIKSESSRQFLHFLVEYKGEEGINAKKFLTRQTIMAIVHPPSLILSVLLLKRISNSKKVISYSNFEIIPKTHIKFIDTQTPMMILGQMKHAQKPPWTNSSFFFLQFFSCKYLEMSILQHQS